MLLHFASQCWERRRKLSSPFGTVNVCFTSAGSHTSFASGTFTYGDSGPFWGGFLFSLVLCLVETWGGLCGAV